MGCIERKVCVSEGGDRMKHSARGKCTARGCSGTAVQRVCGRGERDRDILEDREAGELGRRQARQPVAVQTEVPVVNTQSKERARAHACQPMRVSAENLSDRERCLCACMWDQFQRVREGDRGRQIRLTRGRPCRKRRRRRTM